MEYFKSIFGIEPGEVQHKVILLPLLNKELKSALSLADPHSGILYTTFQTPFATVIRTGVGAPFVGDAVLHLKKSACAEIILLGACGSLLEENEFPVGTLALPSKCLELESFSCALAGGSANTRSVYPDEPFTQSFLQTAGRQISRPTCLTFGSLALEEPMKKDLKNLGAQIIDMECSAFFNAAKASGLKAFALFYISDIIGQKPFFSKQTDEDFKRLVTAIQESAKLIRQFLKV